MGQYWVIVNLDTMETLGNMGKLGESLWDEQAMLVQLLYPPELPSPPRPATSAVARKSPSIRGSPGSAITFDDLLQAPEAIKMVFDHLDTYADVLSFGVTNSSVWKCGERRIQDLYQQERAPWKGHRLICLGDYVKDLPDHLNNAETLCELATTVGYSHRDCHVWFEPDASQKWTRRLLKLAQGIYQNCVGIERGLHLQTDYKLLAGVRSVPGAKAWVCDPRDYDSSRSQRYFRYVDPSDSDEEDSEEVEEYLEPPEPVMVLRNLSKQVYLRSDRLPFTNYDSVWGFGRAILSRICWSTDNSVSMICDRDIHRGVWAGDRFDVVELDEIELSGWKDVTSEVREELITLWKTNWKSHELAPGLA